MNKEQLDKNHSLAETTAVLQSTTDGSSTLFVPALNETYHSVHGAYSESLHVYIENGLNLVAANTNHIRILEIGLGTSLNLLLSRKFAASRLSIDYIAIEPYLPDKSLLRKLYSGEAESLYDSSFFERLYSGEFSQSTSISEGLTFRCIQDKLQNLNQYLNPNDWQADLVYYDAFAPSVQADMWTTETFAGLKSYMSENSLLSTYCAQGQFKRNLKSLDFKLVHPKGAHHKREMTIAYKN